MDNWFLSEVWHGFVSPSSKKNPPPPLTTHLTTAAFFREPHFHILRPEIANEYGECCQIDLKGLPGLQMQFYKHFCIAIISPFVIKSAERSGLKVRPLATKAGRTNSGPQG